MAAPVMLHPMRGGIALPAMKAESTRLPIERIARPRVLVLPLSQHAGTPAEALVEVGMHVDRGQALARAVGQISAHLHAPASGTVVAIEDRLVPHPSGGTAPCIVLETDATDTDWAGLAPLPEWRTCPHDALVAHIREAGIVGLGGAVFPTHIKLGPNPVRPVHTFILNGAECEPYISCDDMLMREHAERVVSGAAILLHALGAERCLIAVEEDKAEAIEALESAMVSHPDGRAQILVRVPARYPQGGERQLVQTLTGRKVPSGGLPLHIGIVCQNVGTAAAVHDAVVLGRPLTSRIVTVTGSGVREPRNLEVPLGTPVSMLIAACGGYTGPTMRLRMGGPMMGFDLPDDTVPVAKAMNCILVTEPETARPVEPCIRCSDCVPVCPEGLLPQELLRFANARDFEQAEHLRLFDCIECAVCDAVCPSHIPLARTFRWAKGEIRHSEEERRKAALAKRRFEARQRRLEDERREREARLKRKQDPAAIEAALARIKAKAREDGTA